MSDNARRMAKLREMAAAELSPGTDPLAPNEVVVSRHRDTTTSRSRRTGSPSRLLVSLTPAERALLDALPTNVSSAAFIRSALRRVAADESLHAVVLAEAVNESAKARSRTHLVISPHRDITTS